MRFNTCSAEIRVFKASPAVRATNVSQRVLLAAPERISPLEWVSARRPVSPLRTEGTLSHTHIHARHTNVSLSLSLSLALALPLTGKVALCLKISPSRSFTLLFSAFQSALPPFGISNLTHLYTCAHTPQAPKRAPVSMESVGWRRNGAGRATLSPSSSSPGRKRENRLLTSSPASSSSSGRDSPAFPRQKKPSRSPRILARLPSRWPAER